MSITCILLKHLHISYFSTESPAVLALSAPSELIEGEPVSIACLVLESRPSPAVYLNISGIEVSSSDVNTNTASIFKPTTMLYRNNITLTMFKREWNGVKVFCCRHNKWYSTPRKCSEAKQVNFLCKCFSNLILYSLITCDNNTIKSLLQG
jgi:hypothetical protein